MIPASTVVLVGGIVLLVISPVTAIAAPLGTILQWCTQYGRGIVLYRVPSRKSMATNLPRWCRSRSIIPFVVEPGASLSVSSVQICHHHSSAAVTLSATTGGNGINNHTIHGLFIGFLVIMHLTGFPVGQSWLHADSLDATRIRFTIDPAHLQEQQEVR